MFVVQSIVLGHNIYSMLVFPQPQGKVRRLAQRQDAVLHSAVLSAAYATARASLYACEAAAHGATTSSTAHTTHRNADTPAAHNRETTC